jgi:hypothetical protein
VKRLVILVKGKPSEKGPAKTNFEAWKAAQLGPPGKLPTRLLNLVQRVASYFSLIVPSEEPSL